MVRRQLGGVRIDSLLPSRRGFGSQTQPARRAQDRQRIEVRSLEQDVRGLGADLAVLAAHDPGDRDRAARVGDYQILRCELALFPVQRRDALAGRRSPHDDPSVVESRPVEGMERRAEGEHDVVRHVDDIRDGPHAGGNEPCPHPDGRVPDRRALEAAADVARTAVEVIHTDVDRFLADGARVEVRAGRRCKLTVRHDGDLPGDAVDRREIRPVEACLDLQHVVHERDDVSERCPGLGAVLEHHDPAVVVPELELALGQDHPARNLPAKLRLAEGLVRPRQSSAGQGDRDRRAGPEVPRAADDLARLALAHVDLAELEPVGVRMLARLEHLADEKETEIAVEVRNAAAHDPVDLAARQDELRRQLVHGHLERDVLAKPGDRNPHHQNCSRKRMSFSQNRRRSGSPCRRNAIRSIPSPNAKPCHSSGS